VAATSVANVTYFYRFSNDNVTWGAWTQWGSPATTAPFSTAFSFPAGYGYYEFYSVATDNASGVEATPPYAQAAVNYQAASGTGQTISFASLSDLPVGSALSLPAATASSGLPVIFNSLTSSVCTVSGNLVSTVSVGTCTIEADQVGDSSYLLPASVTRSFSVLALAQTVTFPSIAGQVLGSGPVTLNAAASSGLPVSYLSLTTGVCTVGGSAATLVSAGTCTLVASQAGNGNYAAAQDVTQSFPVTAAVISTGDSGDVPLPAWALVALAAGLMGAAVRRRAGKQN
jgi:hypothetical protein